MVLGTLEFYMLLYISFWMVPASLLWCSTQQQHWPRQPRYIVPSVEVSITPCLGERIQPSQFPLQSRYVQS